MIEFHWYIGFHSINEPLKLASKKQNLNPMNVVAILASGSDSKFDFE